MISISVVDDNLAFYNVLYFAYINIFLKRPTQIGQTYSMLHSAGQDNSFCVALFFRNNSGILTYRF